VLRMAEVTNNDSGEYIHAHLGRLKFRCRFPPPGLSVVRM
jgi:hypothetical protein